MDFHGWVEETVVGKGSKSDHNALVLRTDRGETLILRVTGDNPFVINPGLKSYVGQEVTIAGTAHRNVLILSSLNDIEIVPPSGGAPKPFPA